MVFVIGVDVASSWLPDFTDSLRCGSLGVDAELTLCVVEETLGASLLATVLWLEDRGLADAASPRSTSWARVGAGAGVGVGTGMVAVAEAWPWVGTLVDLVLVWGACWSGGPSSSESPRSWSFSNRSSSECTTFPLDLAEGLMKTRPS